MHAAENPNSSKSQPARLRTLDLDEPRLQASQLRQIVREASRALALLDAVRLEELALACQRLNRDLPAPSDYTLTAVALPDREAAEEMAVFARVLDATRANLDVMRRLRDLREGGLEYQPGPQKEKLHGHD